jgi:hypothetical protein
MSLATRLTNPIELDANSVRRLPGQEKFNYSDGDSHEKYLRDVLQGASDPGSNSYELEGYIRDWVTEYHLSRKRSQLLRGFAFRRSAKVLEVGCGCGAITRYLGETFDDVVAVEGSLERADGSVWVEKRRLDSGVGGDGKVKLAGYDEKWIGADSIQMQVLRRAKRRSITFSELFEPCAIWIKKIKSAAVMKSGDQVVDGRYLDCIWANSFAVDGECVFIDNEWEWKGDIRVSTLVARSAHYLL